MKKLMFILLPLLFLTACTSHKNQRSLKSHSPNRFSSYHEKEFSKNHKPVVQADRYTMIELDDSTHKYMLDQIINISLPKNLSLTVKEGLNYLLEQSGYKLCENPSNNVLFSNSLPKVQYKMGPIKLGDALQIVAGPAWKLVVDDVEREICFKLKDGYHRKTQKAPEIITIQNETNVAEIKRMAKREKREKLKQQKINKVIKKSPTPEPVIKTEKNVVNENKKNTSNISPKKMGFIQVGQTIKPASDLKNKSLPLKPQAR